ncbi:hypothetical protein [Nocardia sp. BMG111209]|uniref:hypothetical protein n=1 Tax=Nocardia sp. BMG111209 TaxID=1160137 RepID=UPI0012DDCCBA|nr:hypothetical protein [Nocardia sp. BMG111209]
MLLLKMFDVIRIGGSLMLILYIGDLHFSGWSMRGRIAVREKQVPFVERLVELDWPTTETSEGVLTVDDTPPERESRAGCHCQFTGLQALDAEGLLAGSVIETLPRVPVLVDTDTHAVAGDVLAIAEYLDDIASTSGCSLLGTTADQRAEVRSLCAWAAQDLPVLMNDATYAKSLQPKRFSRPEPSAVEQAHWVCDTVAALLDRHGGPYTVGAFSLVDVMLSTYFQQMIGWGITITDLPVADYAQRLLDRRSVRGHLDEAKAIYRAIDAAEPGSPQWIARHYRYRRADQLLHNWQTDNCLRLTNASAARAVDLAYAGRTAEEIAITLAAEYRAPATRVAADVRALFARLDPRHESRAAS